MVHQQGFSTQISGAWWILVNISVGYSSISKDDNYTMQCRLFAKYSIFSIFGRRGRKMEIEKEACTQKASGWWNERFVICQGRHRRRRRSGWERTNPPTKIQIFSTFSCAYVNTAHLVFCLKSGGGHGRLLQSSFPKRLHILSANLGIIS
jgi:hypothetical protein